MLSTEMGRKREERKEGGRVGGRRNLDKIPVLKEAAVKFRR